MSYSDIYKCVEAMRRMDDADFLKLKSFLKGQEFHHEELKGLPPQIRCGDGAVSCSRESCACKGNQQRDMEFALEQVAADLMRFSNNVPLHPGCGWWAWQNIRDAARAWAKLQQDTSGRLSKQYLDDVYKEVTKWEFKVDEEQE